MSKSVIPENYHPKFSFLSWLVRLLLYGSVFASVFLPSYVAIEFEPYGCGDKHFIGLSSGCSARPVEARNNIGTINRAQQAYFLDYNRFADSLTKLEYVIPKQTDNYTYRIIQPMMPVQGLNQSGDSDSDVLIRMAIAQKKENIKRNTINYLGVVYTFPDKSVSGKPETQMLGICAVSSKNPLPSAMPIVTEGDMQCPNGTTKLGY